MNVPDKMKLNRFKEVNLPSNKDYITRFGFGLDGEAGQYTGQQVAQMGMTKTDSLGDENFLNNIQNKFNKSQEEINS